MAAQTNASLTVMGQTSDVVSIERKCLEMSRVTRDVARIEPAPFLAVVLILTGTASPGQIQDIT